MRIEYINARPGGGGRVSLSLSVSGDSSQIFRLVEEVNKGFEKKPDGTITRPYDLFIQPYYEKKSDKQLKAIWSAIDLIAKAVDSTSEEIYLLMLRRYGTATRHRTDEMGLKEMKKDYKIVDVLEERSDNTYFAKCYKGLSKFDSAEAKRFLDGLISELKEMQIPFDLGG